MTFANNIYAPSLGQSLVQSIQRWSQPDVITPAPSPTVQTSTTTPTITQAPKKTIQQFIISTREEAVRASQQAAEDERQSNLVVYAAKYPNAPQEPAALLNAGWHLDRMFTDPVTFWQSVINHWNTLTPGAERENYLSAIRAITFDSIPPEHYSQMLGVMPLNQIAFVVPFIYPEHNDYFAWRTVAGPDDNLEGWLNAMIDQVAAKREAGDQAGAEETRQSVLRIVNTHRPDALANVSEETQVKFVSVLTPEILDAIDAANMQTVVNIDDAKKMGGMALVLIAVLGGFAFVTRKQRKIPGVRKVKRKK